MNAERADQEPTICAHLRPSAPICGVCDHVGSFVWPVSHLRLGPLAPAKRRTARAAFGHRTGPELNAEAADERRTRTLRANHPRPSAASAASAITSLSFVWPVSHCDEVRWHQPNAEPL